MIDNCAAGPRQEMWQLFHRCWTESNGPGYCKANWKDLEVEISKAIDAAVKEERRLCCLDIRCAMSDAGTDDPHLALMWAVQKNREARPIMSSPTKRILAIDPGNKESAFVLLNGLQILTAQIVDNEKMLAIIKEPMRMLGANAAGLEAMVIEMFESMGMAVGKECFETVFWIGRFCQASMVPYHRLYRKFVKRHLCGVDRAKDANIRIALIDKLGPQGTKKAKGPTYGVSKHMWAALAVGVTWQESAAPPLESED